MVVSMKHIITENDKSTLLQDEVNYKYRVLVTDESGHILDTISTMNINNYSIDGASMMRRTFSMTFHLDNHAKPLREYLSTWFPLNFVLQIGIESFRTYDYIWYDCGTYVISDISSVYDATTNMIELKFIDWFGKLDGTRNGQIGGTPTILIPNQDENNNKVTIQQSFTNFLQAEGLNNLIIEELGEFYGVQTNNPNFMEYRKNNPDWDKLPYDLEFNAGNTVGDIVSKFIGLYPNMQAYFDIYNNFCANVIPSCENNPIDLDNDYIQKILIGDNSENVTYDTQSIYNVTEVFGKIYDINRLSETCTTSNSVYNITLESYDSYTGYEYIAFTPNTPNISNMHLKINSLSPIPIYKEYTTEFLPNGTIQKGEQYVVLIKRMDSNNFAAYFLGQYQPHALCVLTNNINDTIFTKDYFANKYNCNNIILREEKESPFTIQKIGEVLDVKSGEEFDSIISDTVALENAIYHNRKASSLHDTVTITTKLIPWLDVMCKIEYKRANENEIVQYLVQNITHNIENGTSTIVMSRFYPLYYS